MYRTLWEKCLPPLPYPLVVFILPLVVSGDDLNEPPEHAILESIAYLLHCILRVQGGLSLRGRGRRRRALAQGRARSCARARARACARIRPPFRDNVIFVGCRLPWLVAM